MKMPKHIQEAIESGPVKLHFNAQGTFNVETPAEFATRIAGMVAEECEQIAYEARDKMDKGWGDVRDPDWSMGGSFAANLVGKRIRAAFGLREKP